MSQSSTTQKNRLRQELTNVPNLLTYGRIAVIPVVLWFVLHDSPLNCFWAAFIYSAASVTDMIDGWLARISGQVSLLGKFLDPLADKLLVTMILITLIPMGRVPVWVVGFIVCRDMAVTGLRAVAAGEGLIIVASDNAKIKTALQLVGIVGLLTHYRYQVDFGFTTSDISFHDVGMWIIYLSLVYSFTSAVAYFRAFIVALDQHQKASG